MPEAFQVCRAGTARLNVAPFAKRPDSLASMIRSRPTHARELLRRRRPARARRRRITPALVVLALGIASALSLTVFGILSGGFGFGAQAAWRALAGELEAAGEPVSFDEVIPPELPDAQNFFASPVIEALLRPAGGALDRATAGAESGAIADAMERAGLLDRRKEYLAAGDRVLAGMHALGLDFAPLAELAARPGARFPIDYDADPPPLEHLAAIEALGDWLAIGAAAEISVGNSEAASRDLLLIVRLAGAVASEPFLASQQTRRKLLDRFARRLRAGIDDGAWSGGQLAALGAAIAPASLSTDFARALRGERARLNSAVENSLANRRPAASSVIHAWLGAGANSLGTGALRSRQVAANRALQLVIDQAAGLEAAEEDAPDLPPDARDHLATIKAEARLFAASQTLLDQVRLACAPRP